MVFISTADSASAISQSFFVPDNAKELVLTYDLVSEEPMEYVKSMYDDQFDVLLNPQPTTSNPNPAPITVARASINTSTWLPIDINFLGGDNTTFHTGFQTVSFDLTAFQGQKVNLSMEVFDKGDSMYDTAALIDNIQITTM